MRYAAALLVVLVCGIGLGACGGPNSDGGTAKAQSGRSLGIMDGGGGGGGGGGGY